jgi:hypothetical protein
MNRRKFFAVTAAAATVSALPISVAASAKFPLIGQPLIGLVISQSQWTSIGDKATSAWGKRFHSIDDSGEWVEVFLNKLRKNAFSGQISPYMTNCPYDLARAAYTMIDMEKYSIIKSRNPGNGYPFIKIPLGADRELVIQNRIEYLDKMGYARDAMGNIG